MFATMPETKPDATALTGPREDLAHLLSLTVHELRTPTSVVAGYLKMLRSGRHGALPADVQHIVEAADRSCGRVLELVAEIGDLCHLVDGRARFARTEVIFGTLVDETIAACAAAEDRDVRRTGDTAPGGVVLADRQRLGQVVDTMLTAILREVPADAPVLARLAARSEGFTLIVGDGRADLDVFLAPARRGHLEQWRGGLGLRLPIAERVVALEGGTLWSPAGADEPSLIGLDLPRHRS